MANRATGDFITWIVSLDTSNLMPDLYGQFERPTHAQLARNFSPWEEPLVHPRFSPVDSTNAAQQLQQLAQRFK
jgi:hypothetical protein